MCLPASTAGEGNDHRRCSGLKTSTSTYVVGSKRSCGAMDDGQVAPPIALRWRGCMRVGEATQLIASDLDLTPRHECLFVRESKTKAGRRTIPIVPELQPHLQRWVERLQSEHGITPRLPLLATRNGTPMKSTYSLENHQAGRFPSRRTRRALHVRFDPRRTAWLRLPKNANRREPLHCHPAHAPPHLRVGPTQPGIASRGRVEALRPRLHYRHRTRLCRAP
jgi:integrase